MYAKKEFILAAILLTPSACASPIYEVFAEGTSDESSGDGDSDGTFDVGTMDGSSEDSSSGVDSSFESGDGDESTNEESGTSNGDGDGDGDGDDSSSSSSDSSSGDGDGDGDAGTDGGNGEEKLPGDLCDPFVDTCVDLQGFDYECTLDYEMVDSDYETVFKCNNFNNSNEGELGEACVWGHEGCRTGSFCTASELAFPNASCQAGVGQCCAELCYFGQVCDNGPCYVVEWEADLADYLDSYQGIGYCPGD